ncbi:MAG: mitochondrial fusion and transport protein ugo1 [Peltula sp. TS41687]|nr:MAG: mitochondrial fusion and transport protein ugo1 [Peltula sp. TS41687]
MSTTREGPNPLRPYYIPPSVGLPPDPTTTVPNSSSTSSTNSPFTSSARGIFSDLDYSEYLSDASPSVSELIKKLLDQALWKYSSVLIAQPFEVAKTILQCYDASAVEGSKRPSNRRRNDIHRHGNDTHDDLPSDDSDVDELAYFTSTRPSAVHRPSSTARHRHTTTTDETPPPTPSSSPYKLELRRPDSLLEVISQLWAKEGGWGVWKGSNASFLHTVLLKTIESWTRSLLAALFNISDAGLLTRLGVGGVSVADSSQPLASLAIAVVSAGFAGVLLSPLDTIRTRLILTPVTKRPRSILPTLSALPSYTCPSTLLPITLLHSTLPTLLSTSTPLLLRTYLAIDPRLTPTTYSLLSFLSSAIELFLRLPLETVLRRGQADFALLSFSSTTRKSHSQPHSARTDTTIVEIGPFRGLFRTVWTLLREGQDGDAEGRRRRHTGGRGDHHAIAGPPGIHGLWRGWRVGMWGLVGMWGATALGNGAGGASGGEF